MKRGRFTEEQIIAVLREHEAGAKAGELARKHGISEATLYNWKAKYGGLDVSEAKRLRLLEDENRKLKKLLAESVLDNAALKEQMRIMMQRIDDLTRQVENMKQQQQQHIRSCKNDANYQRDMKKELQRNRRSDDLCKIAGGNGDLGEDPQNESGWPGVALAACLRKVAL